MVTLPALIPSTQIHCCLQHRLAVQRLHQIPATQRFNYLQPLVIYIPVLISLKILGTMGLNLKSAIGFPLGYIHFSLTSLSF